jgi:hypothetical protein
MFGFLLGTLCLIGLVRVITRRHWGHRHGHWHGRGYHGGFGPRYALHRVLARLDAAPGQEKVITAAVSEFMDQARESGREVRETRRAVAEALRGDRVDEARLNEVFGQHDATLERVRRASVDALRKVHEALDERQRRILGDLFESGFYGVGHGGCGAYC